MTDSKTSTKMARATDIVKTALADGDRPKVIISNLMEQLDMTQAAASTYFYTVKGRLTGTKPSKKAAKAAEQAKKDARNAKRREARAAKKAAVAEDVSTRGQVPLDETVAEAA